MKIPADSPFALLTRANSLAWACRQLDQARADGEEVLAAAAAVERTGEVLRDARIAAEWEEKVEAALDRYAAALMRVGWELRESQRFQAFPC